MKDFNQFLEIINSDEFIDSHQRYIDEGLQEPKGDDVSDFERVASVVIDSNRQYAISAIRAYHEWVNETKP